VIFGEIVAELAGVDADGASLREPPQPRVTRGLPEGSAAPRSRSRSPRPRRCDPGGRAIGATAAPLEAHHWSSRPADAVAAWARNAWMLASVLPVGLPSSPS
jgi:hypothetical protein